VDDISEKNLEEIKEVGFLGGSMLDASTLTCISVSDLKSSDSAMLEFKKGLLEGDLKLKQAQYRLAISGDKSMLTTLSAERRKNNRKLES